MKKIVAVLTAVVILLSAAGCSKTGFVNENKIEITSETKEVFLDESWKYADFSVINTGCSVFYRASSNRKNIVVGINAAHGTNKGEDYYTYCHPDKSPKLIDGSTKSGNVKSTAITTGMTFNDGKPESEIALEEARLLKDRLLNKGYDVLMVRDSDDVRLDNIARAVICNYTADCHISLHWDDDGTSFGEDKGCFYFSIPKELHNLDPVCNVWKKSNELGDCLIDGLSETGLKIFSDGRIDCDLTQTSFSTIPSVSIELGNAFSDISTKQLQKLCDGLEKGIDAFFGF